MLNAFRVFHIPSDIVHKSKFGAQLFFRPHDHNTLRLQLEIDNHLGKASRQSSRISFSHS